MLRTLIVKGLAKSIVSDNVLKDRVYKIVRNPKYDGYQKSINNYGL